MERLINDPPCLLFEFSDHKMRPILFSHPIEVIAVNEVDDVLPAMRRIQDAVDAGFFAAGYVSYEAAPAFDPAFEVKKGHCMPLLWFGIFHVPYQADSPENKGHFTLSRWEPSLHFEDYHAHLLKIQKAIQNGETYQVNYSMRLRAAFSGDDFTFYRWMTHGQHTRYSAYLNLGQFRILSASPELFFHWKNGKIITRPMKGTAKRGRWVQEDNRQALQLNESSKNRAENVMIVDLLRNDLGNIAKPGSVLVSRLFEIERYPTVMQMTSTIKANVKPHMTLEDIFSALFPCGSVTGAPKIQTMKIISQLEDAPRGVYCGAIGFITPEKEAVFNVPIRTVTIDTKSMIAEYGTGGGITADSTTKEEYEETFIKAKMLTDNRPDFNLLESIKLENGRYDLLERHLARLSRSAKYFDFEISMDKIRKQFIQYAEVHKIGMIKVRLLVSKKGKITIEGAPIEKNQYKDSQPVAIAKTSVSKDDIFLYHKTSHREVYEYHRKEHPDVFDVLLWNESSEYTEFTNGNLVVEREGQMWTPPRECGLLDGTFREELLSKGKIKECILTKKDLASCTRLWLINSVRGWVLVHVVS